MFYYVLIRVSGIRYDKVLMAAPFAIALLSFIGGHAAGYQEAKDFTWSYVHDFAPDEFGPDWEGLDRDENFRRYVGYHR